MSFGGEMVPHKEESPLESLRALDWDFPERVAHSDIEGIHPYPAKFITEIPRGLIECPPASGWNRRLGPILRERHYFG